MADGEQLYEVETEQKQYHDHRDDGDQSHDALDDTSMRRRANGQKQDVASQRHHSPNSAQRRDALQEPRGSHGGPS